MDDTTNLNPPAVVKELAQAAATLGFTMSSNLLTGSLLRTLVAFFALKQKSVYNVYRSQFIKRHQDAIGTSMS